MTIVINKHKSRFLTVMFLIIVFLIIVFSLSITAVFHVFFIYGVVRSQNRIDKPPSFHNNYDSPFHKFSLLSQLCKTPVGLKVRQCQTPDSMAMLCKTPVGLKVKQCQTPDSMVMLCKTPVGLKVWQCQTPDSMAMQQSAR